MVCNLICSHHPWPYFRISIFLQFCFWVQPCTPASIHSSSWLHLQRSERQTGTESLKRVDYGKGVFCGHLNFTLRYRKKEEEKVFFVIYKLALFRKKPWISLGLLLIERYLRKAIKPKRKKILAQNFVLQFISFTDVWLVSFWQALSSYNDLVLVEAAFMCLSRLQVILNKVR